MFTINIITILLLILNTLEESQIEPLYILTEDVLSENFVWKLVVLEK